MSKHREQIIAAASGVVDERILGAAFAKPRGSTTAVAAGGAVAREIGQQWKGRHEKGADAAGIALGNPGAVAVTATDLVTMQVKVSIGGQIKAIDEILTTVPLSEVDSVEVKRLGLAGVMEIRLGEASFKLEGKVNDLREFAGAFETAKAAAS